MIRTAVLIVGFLVSGSLVACSQVVSDSFDDGSVFNGSDPSDVSWFGARPPVGSPASLSIVNDTTLGNGNALAVDGDPTAFSGSTQTQSGTQPIFAAFDAQTLANIGDSVTLSFDYRFAKITGGQHFRFGLYNSNGTAADTNAPTSSDDFGYFFGFPVGGGGGGGDTLSRESGGNSTLTAGSDISTLSDQGNAVSINVLTKQNALISVQKVAAGAQISVSLGSGKFSFDFTDSVAPIFNFDEIVLSVAGSTSSGAQTELDYHIDNVRVTAVPEPAPLHFVLTGGILWGMWTLGRRCFCSPGSRVLAVAEKR